MYNVKNYTEPGGDRTVIGGTLEILDGAEVTGLPDSGGSASGRGHRAPAENASTENKRMNSTFFMAYSSPTTLHRPEVRPGNTPRATWRYPFLPAPPAVSSGVSTPENGGAGNCANGP